MFLALLFGRFRSWTRRAVVDDETDEEYHAVNRYPARRDTKRSAHREHQERFDSFFAHVCVFAFLARLIALSA